ncbi:outer membrane protein [Erythrobacter sp. BLCC-B19]|uniref:outer membrane protein n=1 Tax=Erythrobacter sp. BLCC-B19 TaxID=3025315 RepID=UPI0023610805|nr:outer membrane beta-barrel protein [Erythrobacter sp. BLCC-B19]WDA41204.1 outer membrane beta-barrel protein [Erythrobacter sp. BLCC-B19]
MALIKHVSPAIGVTALLISSSAFAQEDEPYFNGPYISGAIGLESAADSRNDSILFDTDQDGTFGDTVTTAAGADAFSPGFCDGSPVAVGAAGCRGNRQNEGYALRIGYDRQLGKGPLVAGILVEGARPGLEEFTTGFSTTPATYTFGREIDWAVNGRARLGIAPGDGRGLFYATGGVGYARIDHSFSTSNGANSFTPDNVRDWQFGWQAGGGAELMLTRNLGVGLEYLYSSYNDDDYNVAVGPGTAPATNPFLLESGGTDMRLSNDRFDYHALRATVNLRF